MGRRAKFAICAVLIVLGARIVLSDPTSLHESIIGWSMLSIGLLTLGWTVRAGLWLTARFIAHFTAMFLRKLGGHMEKVESERFCQVTHRGERCRELADWGLTVVIHDHDERKPYSVHAGGIVYCCAKHHPNRYMGERSGETEAMLKDNNLKWERVYPVTRLRF